MATFDMRAARCVRVDVVVSRRENRKKSILPRPAFRGPSRVKSAETLARSTKFINRAGNPQKRKSRDPFRPRLALE